MSSPELQSVQTAPARSRLARVRAILDRTLPFLPPLLALWMLRGVFTADRIFYVRDLTLYTWPLTRWMRATVAQGHMPLWNPSVAFGQSVVGDPSLQLFFPFTILSRVFLPDPFGINIAVALAYPAAALGAYLWLRRRMTPGAASLGATLFVASGPFLAMGYMLNLSWSTALTPWILWGTDAVVARPNRRTISILATLFALLAFAGEPLVLTVTAAIAVVSAATGAALIGTASWRSIARSTGCVIAAGLLGALVAAAQLLIAFDQSARSLRSDGALQDEYQPQWFVLADVVVPNLFGSTLSHSDLWGHWFYAMHGGNEPVLLSLYCGAGAVILALVGVTSGRHTRWAILLGVVVLASVVLSLGMTTPLYPALKHLPVFSASRIPLKFMAFAVLGIAGLAAEGWDALRRPLAAFGRWRHWLALGGGVAFVAVSGYVFAWCRLWPADAQAVASRFASTLALPLADAHGAALVVQTGNVAPRVLVVSVIAVLCIWLGASARGYGSWLRAALFLAVVADLTAANSNLNPTIPLDEVSRPPWVELTAEHPNDRIFITGHPELAYESGLTRSSVFPRLSPVRDAATWCAALPVYGMGNGRRDGLTIDLAVMAPRRYIDLVSRTFDVDMAGRARMLRRSNVRYVIARVPPSEDARELIRIDTLEAMALYIWEPSPRAVVVSDYEVRGTTGQQIDALFAEDVDPDAVAVLATEPPLPAGIPSAVAPGLDAENGSRAVDDDSSRSRGLPTLPDGSVEAVILSETPTEIVVSGVAGPGGGFLKLRDLYDPNWFAEVDGAPAEVLVTEGIFRCVRIAEGPHDVRFKYQPRILTIGFWLSWIGFVVVAALAAVPRRRRPLGPAVDTELEPEPEHADGEPLADGVDSSDDPPSPTSRRAEEPPVA